MTLSLQSTTCPLQLVSLSVSDHVEKSFSSAKKSTRRYQYISEGRSSGSHYFSKKCKAKQVENLNLLIQNHLLCDLYGTLISRQYQLQAKTWIAQKLALEMASMGKMVFLMALLSPHNLKYQSHRNKYKHIHLMKHT